MLLTNSETKELVSSLLDCRVKLLWLIEQKPVNDEQRRHIENGKELLKRTNQLLGDFHVEIPT